MSHMPDKLYELLPAVHRVRDAEKGEPLRALLELITDQLEVLERQPFGGPLTVRIEAALHTFGGGIAAAMRVEIEPQPD